MGIDIGAGAVWIASSGSNELVKVRSEDRTILTTYAVGEGPDAVKFDGDRVFVADRTSRNVPLIRLL
jgi:DNA-binding beta-propeller fold protein YncE